MESIARLTGLNYIHAMIIERLRTYGTTLEPSQRTKSRNQGPFLADLMADLLALSGAILARMGRMQLCSCLLKP